MPLPPPEHLIRFFPISGTPVETLVGDTAPRIRHIMHGKDDRLLVIMGPCSIHDPVAALEYARKLKAERERHAGHARDRDARVLRESRAPRSAGRASSTTPTSTRAIRIDEGLRIARQLLLEINRLGMPAGSEFST
jgi:3-deoxy-7-phosphoheptulonate synthase